MLRTTKTPWLMVTLCLALALPATAQWPRRWATHYTPAQGAVATSVLIDTTGNVYVAGMQPGGIYYYVEKYNGVTGEVLWTATPYELLHTEPPAGSPPACPARPILVGDWSLGKLYLIGNKARYMSQAYLLKFSDLGSNSYTGYDISDPGTYTWPTSAVLGADHHLYVAGHRGTLDFPVSNSTFCVVNVDPTPNPPYPPTYTTFWEPTTDHSLGWGTVAIARGTLTPMRVYVAGTVDAGGQGAYKLVKYDMDSLTKVWQIVSSSTGVDQHVEALAIANIGGLDTVYVTGRRVTNLGNPDVMLDKSSFLTAHYIDSGNSVTEHWVRAEGLVSFACPGVENAYYARAGGYGVACDAAGNCYVTGAGGRTVASDDYSFVTMKYSSAGGDPIWYNALDRGNFDLGRRIVIDSGIVYATGCSFNTTRQRLDFATVLYAPSNGARSLIGYYVDSNSDLHDWGLGLAVRPGGSMVAITGGVAPEKAMECNPIHYATNWATVVYNPPDTNGPEHP